MRRPYCLPWGNFSLFFDLETRRRQKNGTSGICAEKVCPLVNGSHAWPTIFRHRRTNLFFTVDQRDSTIAVIEISCAFCGSEKNRVFFLVVLPAALPTRRFWTSSRRIRTGCDLGASRPRRRP